MANFLTLYIPESKMSTFSKPKETCVVFIPICTYFTPRIMTINPTKINVFYNRTLPGHVRVDWCSHVRWKGQIWSLTAAFWTARHRFWTRLLSCRCRVVRGKLSNWAMFTERWLEWGLGGKSCQMKNRRRWRTFSWEGGCDSGISMRVKFKCFTRLVVFGNKIRQWS